MWRSIQYYALVIAGFAMLLAAVFIVPKQPLWLLLFVPALSLWSIWLIREYWKWVRTLGT